MIAGSGQRVLMYNSNLGVKPTGDVRLDDSGDEKSQPHNSDNHGTKQLRLGLSSR